MARLHGRSGLVYIGASQGAVASPVAYLSAWNISFAGDWSDVTPHGDPNLEYVYGLADVTGDFAGFYDDASVQLYAEARDGLPRSFYLYPDWADDPAQYWFGELIAAFTLSGGITSPVTVKATWKAASDIHRNDFRGFPPVNVNIAGAAAAVGVAGTAGALKASANIAGAAAAVTVAGGSGHAGSAPAIVAGTAAAVTVAGGTGIPSGGAIVTGTAAAVSVVAGIGLAEGHGTTVVAFTTAGSSTWLCPVGVTSVSVANTGGGGNGGAGGTDLAAGGLFTGGGGGGGGENAQDTCTVTPGNSYNYTVGAAGAASAFGPDDLAKTVTANHGGNGGAANSSGTPGTAGAAGSGSTSAAHHNGGAGRAGSGSTFSSGSGGGGAGSGGTSAAGNPGGATTGATAVTGGGPGGDGGSAGGGAGSAPATGPGGGGGGGSGSGNAGGAGHAGQVQLSYTT